MAGVIVVVVAWALNYPLARWNISVSNNIMALESEYLTCHLSRLQDHHGKQRINV